MNLDEHVYDLLSGVGDTYPVVLPLGSLLPAVVYQRISTSRERSHDGTSLIGALYQMRALAASPTDAREVAREVIALFEPLLGEAQVQNTFETYDPDRKTYAAIVDVRVWKHAEDDLASS